ncbi:MAG: hypothetical protein Q8P67_16220, partial [archaeon]|nr:hypothetical protein [archaeon]
AQDFDFPVPTQDADLTLDFAPAPAPAPTSSSARVDDLFAEPATHFEAAPASSAPAAASSAPKTNLSIYTQAEPVCLSLIVFSVFSSLLHP